jgi:hypothetical protein
VITQKILHDYIIHGRKVSTSNFQFIIVHNILNVNSEYNTFVSEMYENNVIGNCLCQKIFWQYQDLNSGPCT